MAQRLVAQVTPDGQVMVEAQGFQGPGCKQATAQLIEQLASLGLTLGVETTQDTPEMMAREVQVERGRTTQ